MITRKAIKIWLKRIVSNLATCSILYLEEILSCTVVKGMYNYEKENPEDFKKPNADNACLALKGMTQSTSDHKQKGEVIAWQMTEMMKHDGDGFRGKRII